LVTKVQKWGNSQGIRLSRQVLAEADIDVGDSVDLEVHEGAIVVKPVRRLRRRHDLRELARRVPEGYEPQELDWGPPVGREVW
jgi:antitoxin MazE